MPEVTITHRYCLGCRNPCSVAISTRSPVHQNLIYCFKLYIGTRTVVSTNEYSLLCGQALRSVPESDSYSTATVRLMYCWVATALSNTAAVCWRSLGRHDTSLYRKRHALHAHVQSARVLGACHTTATVYVRRDRRRRASSCRASHDGFCAPAIIHITPA